MKSFRPSRSPFFLLALHQVKKPEGPLDSQPSRPRQFAHNGQRQPFSLITHDVVDATMQCMLASCRKIENRPSSSSSSSSTVAHHHPQHLHPAAGSNPEVVELESEAAVIEELGRCLRQIINAANKTAGSGAVTAPSSSTSYAS